MILYGPFKKQCFVKRTRRLGENIYQRHTGQLSKIYKEICQLKIITCHLFLQEWSHSPLQLLTMNTPWKEFRMEIRNEALGALAKTGRTGLQTVIFRRRFYEPNFLHHLISRKILKSLMETSAPPLGRQTVISSNPLPKCVLDCMDPLHQKPHAYWPPPLPLQNSSSELSERLSPRWWSHFAPNKT